MATQNSIPARPGSQRRLIAAGIRRGTAPMVTIVLSDADRAAHEAASYVRRSAKAAA
jgi:hypothetical protein